MSTSKEKVIDSAQVLFHLNGFQNTSIDDILKQTGVTKSNLYYHFKSKEELGLLILEKRISEYEKKFFLETLGDTSISPEQRLKNYYKKVTTYHKNLNCRNGCPFGNLALEMSDINEKFRLRLSEFFSHWQKIIELCIKEGIKQKQFRGDISPKTISQLIISHLEGAILMAKTHRSIIPLRSGSKTIMKLIEAT
ncbi:MAG: TetR family transcriptional regulator C-terminal domain-containing protein [Deltaproteobacteria bacterium]|nr:TetR family transcriptional regulator C-terminal domain-containing protein [Deltaproteobacteria bacterium]